LFERVQKGELGNAAMIEAGFRKRETPPDRLRKAWVQHFKDRPNLVLQWIDPLTGKRCSQSAKTSDEQKAEKARGDKLNNGLHRGTNRTTWDDFRKAFWEQYVEPARLNTQKNYRTLLDLFEQLTSIKRMGRSPRTL
jgi:hypothetical protein